MVFLVKTEKPPLSADEIAARTLTMNEPDARAFCKSSHAPLTPLDAGWRLETNGMSAFVVHAGEHEPHRASSRRFSCRSNVGSPKSKAVEQQ
jgi:hypothetical protein